MIPAPCPAASKDNNIIHIMIFSRKAHASYEACVFLQINVIASPFRGVAIPLSLRPVAGGRGFPRRAKKVEIATSSSSAVLGRHIRLVCLDIVSPFVLSPTRGACRGPRLNTLAMTIYSALLGMTTGFSALRHALHMRRVFFILLFDGVSSIMFRRCSSWTEPFSKN